MKSAQNGFTLIELVMVIVILGVLSAVAVPQFIDMRTDARTAAVQSVAGSITSASSMNYSARLVGGTDTGEAIDATLTCSTAAIALLQNGVLPTDISLDATTTLSGTSGTSNTCTVTHAGGGETSTAYIISIP